MMYIARTALTIQQCNEAEARERIFITITEFCKLNRIKQSNLVSIIFSQTDDITNLNPAGLLRMNPGFEHVALFCASEPTYPNSLSQTIRMLICFRKHALFFTPKPLYTFGAEILRPDL